MCVYVCVLQKAFWLKNSSYIHLIQWHNNECVDSELKRCSFFQNTKTFILIFKWVIMRKRKLFIDKKFQSGSIISSSISNLIIQNIYMYIRNRQICWKWYWCGNDTFYFSFLIPLQPKDELLASRHRRWSSECLWGVHAHGNHSLRTVGSSGFWWCDVITAVCSPPSSGRMASQWKASPWETAALRSCVWASRPTRWTAGRSGPAVGPRSSASQPTTTSASSSTRNQTSSSGESHVWTKQYFVYLFWIFKMCSSCSVNVF